MRFILFAMLASCLSLGLQAVTELDLDLEKETKLAKGGAAENQYMLGPMKHNQY